MNFPLTHLCYNLKNLMNFAQSSLSLAVIVYKFPASFFMLSRPSHCWSAWASWSAPWVPYHYYMCPAIMLLPDYMPCPYSLNLFCCEWGILCLKLIKACEILCSLKYLMTHVGAIITTVVEAATIRVAPVFSRSEPLRHHFTTLILPFTPEKTILDMKLKMWSIEGAVCALHNCHALLFELLFNQFRVLCIICLRAEERDRYITTMRYFSNGDHAYTIK